MASPQTPADGDERSYAEKLYDRSTRLWGADGQKSLSEAHVVLLGASATGCEILKNVVLPGLGRFTIVDDSAITKQDLGRNFFLRPDSLGKNIAEEAVTLITELNPFVEGHAFKESPEAFVKSGGHGFLHGKVGDEFAKSEDPIKNRPAAFQRPPFKATHIIVSGNRVSLQVLSALCCNNSADVPIFYVASNGMTAALRIFAPAQGIVDTVPGPDEKLFDPRIVHHFPALKEIIEKLNPEDPEMDGNTFSHLPWLAIAYHALRRWRTENNMTEKDLPKTFPEIKQVKEVIDQLCKIQAKTARPEGFDEAKANLNSCLNFDRIPSELAEVFALAPTRSSNEGATPFWVLADCVRQFREEKGYLPLQPALPDFTTSTQIYLSLSRAFKAHHEVEVEDVRQRALKWLEQNAKHSSITAEAFDAKAVHNFLINIRFIQFQEYPSLEEEFGNDFDKPFTFTKLSANEQNEKVFGLKVKSNDGTGTTASAIGWYTAFRAALLFASQQNNNRFPGQVSSADDVSNSTDADEQRVLQLAQDKLWGDALLNSNADGASQNAAASLPENVKKQVQEIVRYGGSELGQIASIMGAVASQEVIKFIQHKRVPATPWCIFDGNTSKFIQIEQQN